MLLPHFKMENYLAMSFVCLFACLFNILKKLLSQEAIAFLYW